MRETVLLAIVLSAGSAAARNHATVISKVSASRHSTDTTITAAQAVTSGSFTGAELDERHWQSAAVLSRRRR